MISRQRDPSGSYSPDTRLFNEQVLKRLGDQQEEVLKRLDEQRKIVENNKQQLIAIQSQSQRGIADIYLLLETLRADMKQDDNDHNPPLPEPEEAPQRGHPLRKGNQIFFITVSFADSKSS